MMRSLLALLFLAGCSLANPIPKAKPKPVRPAIGGEYIMVMFGSKYLAYFGATDGYYKAEDGSTRYYEGKWELKGDELIIRERCVDATNGSIEDVNYSTLSFPLLPGELRTKAASVYSLSLTPLPRSGSPHR